MVNTIKSDYVVYLDKNYNISTTKNNKSRYVVKLNNLRYCISSITCKYDSENWQLKCRPTKSAEIEKIEITLPVVNGEQLFHHRYYSVSGGIYDEFTYSCERTIVGERFHAIKGRSFYDTKGHDITDKIEIHLGMDVQKHIFSDEEKFQLEVLHGDLMFIDSPRKLADDIVWKYDKINNVIKEYYNEKSKQSGRSFLV